MSTAIDEPATGIVPNRKNSSLPILLDRAACLARAWRGDSDEAEIRQALRDLSHEATLLAEMQVLPRTTLIARRQNVATRVGVGGEKAERHFREQR